MELVIIESPFAANDEHTKEEHIEYARRCVRHCLDLGEAPFVSHLLYTQPGILNDDDPDERRRGINAGFAFRAAIKKTVIYLDYGKSKGMIEGEMHARDYEADGHVVELRYIGKNPV